MLLRHSVKSCLDYPILSQSTAASQLLFFFIRNFQKGSVAILAILRGLLLTILMLLTIPFILLDKLRKRFTHKLRQGHTGRRARGSPRDTRRDQRGYGDDENEILEEIKGLRRG